MRNALIILMLCFLESGTLATVSQGSEEPKIFDAWHYYVRLQFENERLTEANVLKAMTALRIDSAEIALAQAKFESGHFKSNIAKNGNNLFGMKLAKRRATTAIGTYGGHAKYLHWFDSVLDYKLWQLQRRVVGDYYEYLQKRGYNSCPSYWKAIKRMRK